MGLGLLLVACGGDATPPIKPPPPPDPPTVTSSDTTDPTPAAAADAGAMAKPRLDELELGTLKGIVDAVGAHDAKKLGELYTSDAVVTVYGQDAIKGRDAIVADTQRWLDGVPDMKLEMSRVFLKGDMVVAEWTFSGAHTGDAAGFKATKRPVGVAGVSVLWFDVAGLIRKEHRIADKATLLAQDDKRAKPGTFRAPPAPTTEMETHTSKGGADEEKLADIAHQLFVAIEAKKEPDALALLADDFIFEDLAQTRTFSGPKDAKALYAAFEKTLPDAKVSTISLGVDDLVATEGELTSTVKGDKKVLVHFVTVLRIKNGKVVKGWRYTNGAELADQLHPPPPASKKTP